MTNPSWFKDENGTLRVALNPKMPIPMNVCRLCWNILDDSTAYCRRCGHVGTVFRYKSAGHQRCFTHHSKPATDVCNYCSRPFCDECLETNEGSILSMGTYSYHCHLCLSDIKRIKLLQEGRNKTMCFRHPDKKVHGACLSCGEEVCEFCSYRPIVGIFSKRVGQGIFCFSCVRQLISDKKVRRTVIEHFAGTSFREHMF